MQQTLQVQEAKTVDNVSVFLSVISCSTTSNAGFMRGSSSQTAENEKEKDFVKIQSQVFQFYGSWSDAKLNCFPLQTKVNGICFCCRERGRVN